MLEIVGRASRATPALSMHGICNPITCNVGIHTGAICMADKWLCDNRLTLLCHKRDSQIYLVRLTTKINPLHILPNKFKFLIPFTAYTEQTTGRMS